MYYRKSKEDDFEVELNAMWIYTFVPLGASVLASFYLLGAHYSLRKDKS
jgi:hypothetical protein